MARLPGERPEASPFGVWLRFAAPLEAHFGALQRTKSPVETKFDLQRPFLSGLGSIRDFLGFLGGHGDGSRFCRGNRAQEAVCRHILRN